MVKPTGERGRSPAHISALEKYDESERRLARHQSQWHCGPPNKAQNEDAHQLHGLDEHRRLVTERDTAREAARVADPKTPTPKKRSRK